VENYLEVDLSRPLERLVFITERAKAFGKHRTLAKSVNCFDGGTFEEFVRLFSGEAGDLLAMLDSRIR
jgi:hypothetical protein